MELGDSLRLRYFTGNQLSLLEYLVVTKLNELRIISENPSIITQYENTLIRLRKE